MDHLDPNLKKLVDELAASIPKNWADLTRAALHQRRKNEFLIVAADTDQKDTHQHVDHLQDATSIHLASAVYSLVANEGDFSTKAATQDRILEALDTGTDISVIRSNMICIMFPGAVNTPDDALSRSENMFDAAQNALLRRRPSITAEAVLEVLTAEFDGLPLDRGIAKTVRLALGLDSPLGPGG